MTLITQTCRLPWRLLLALLLLPSLQGFEPARAARWVPGVNSATLSLSEHLLTQFASTQLYSSRHQDSGLNHSPWQGALPSDYFTFLLLHERGLLPFSVSVFLPSRFQTHFSARAPPYIS